jgi:hypothetical protein
MARKELDNLQILLMETMEEVDKLEERQIPMLFQDYNSHLLIMHKDSSTSFYSSILSSPISTPQEEPT